MDGPAATSFPGGLVRKAQPPHVHRPTLGRPLGPVGWLSASRWTARPRMGARKGSADPWAGRENRTGSAHGEPGELPAGAPLILTVPAGDRARGPTVHRRRTKSERPPGT